MNSSPDVEIFRALHAAREILLLPNVWDAGSAALFRDAGAKAIATTSAGLAWACGYPDGDVLPRAELLAAVGRIRRVTTGLPLSVDIEAGYSRDPDAVAELVALLIDAEVAGVNLEDEGAEPSVLTAKMARGRVLSRAMPAISSGSRRLGTKRPSAPAAA